MNLQDQQQLEVVIARYKCDSTEALVNIELARQYRDLEIMESILNIEALQFAKPGRGFMVDGKRKRDSHLPDTCR